FHLIRAQRAIQSDNERLRVRNRNQKRFHGLTAQVSSGFVDDGSRNHQRNFPSRFFKNFRNGEKRGFAIERIEDGFDNQKIDTSFDQCLCLLEVRLFKLVERDSSESGIAYIG